MADHLNVDFDGMASAESNLRTLSGDAENMATLAEDADPDWYTWGLPGVLFASSYSNMSGTLCDQIGQLPEALSGHADRIKGCADRYRTKEDDNVGIMSEIQSRLDGGTWSE